MKFLKPWPNRTRRPFQIVPQGLARRGSFLAKTKIGACRWSSCTSRFCFLCVGCGTKHSRCRAGSSRANRAAASRRKEKGMEEWSGALADAPFSGATRLELANHVARTGYHRRLVLSTLNLQIFSQSCRAAGVSAVFLHSAQRKPFALEENPLVFYCFLKWFLLL